MHRSYNRLQSVGSSACCPGAPFPCFIPYRRVSGRATLIENKRTRVGYWQNENNIRRALGKAIQVFGIEKVRFVQITFLFGSYSHCSCSARGLVFCNPDRSKTAGISSIGDQAKICYTVNRNVPSIRMGYKLSVAREAGAAKATREGSG